MDKNKAKDLKVFEEGNISSILNKIRDDIGYEKYPY